MHHIILELKFHRDKDYQPQRKNLKWPLKHRVTSADSGIWRRFLKHIFSVGNFRLITPLGSWIHGLSDCNWDWYTGRDNFLYHRLGKDLWERHLIKVNCHHTYHTESLLLQEDPITPLCKASISHMGDRIYLLNTSNMISTTSNDTGLHATYDEITTSPPSVDWFMNYISHSSSTGQLLSSLQNGTAVAVSDGSYYPDTQIGSCGWIIASTNGGEWIQGGGIIPGDKKDQCSHRSELGGQVGIASFLHSLLLPPSTNPPLTHITTICDGLSALNQVGLPTHFIKVKHKHADLVSLITSLWEHSGYSHTKEHIKAHQDDFYGPLTLKASLNCKMDGLAKYIAMAQISSPHRHPSFTPTTLGFGTVTCHGHWISSKMQRNLYHNIVQKDLINKIAGYLKVNVCFFKDWTNWQALNTARKECSHKMRIFITKWVSGDTATGTVMVHRQQRLSSNCPLCAHPTEDTTHVLQCPSPSSSSLRSRLLAEFKCYMMSVDTHPDIINFFVSGIRSWTSSTQFIIGSGVTPSLQRAFKIQLKIGWEGLLFGLLAAPITSCQHVYYKSLGYRKSGMRWSVNIINKLWNFVFQLWHNRNTLLHQSSAITSLSGGEHLRAAIVLEHTLGLKDLPSVYLPYFSSLTQLLHKSIKHQKLWFLVVQSGREACTSFSHYDSFSTDPALRLWVGLSPLS